MKPTIFGKNNDKEVILNKIEELAEVKSSFYEAMHRCVDNKELYDRVSKAYERITKDIEELYKELEDE